MNITLRPFAFSRIALPKVSGRVALMRINRLLAWALLVSPVLQWRFRMDLGTGFAIDFCIFLAHCLLSLRLFGIPKRKGGGFEASMHLFGLRARGMTPRNDFLISGYRLFLGLMWSLFFFLPLFGWTALIGGIYIFPRMPLTLLEHVIGAVTMALRRNGVNELAEAFAVVIAIAYVAVSLCNIFLR